jgi:hypothetical protein
MQRRRRSPIPMLKTMMVEVLGFGEEESSFCKDRGLVVGNGNDCVDPANSVEVDAGFIIAELVVEEPLVVEKDAIVGDSVVVGSNTEDMVEELDPSGVLI